MTARERAQRVKKAIELLDSVSFGPLLDELLEIHLNGLCSLAFHKEIINDIIVRRCIKFHHVDLSKGDK